MVVQLLVVVRGDVAAREDVFQVLGEFGVDRHHVFEVAVLGAVFHHQNLAVALDDGGLDLADLLIHENFVRQMAVENLLTDFRNTLRAERIGRAGPAERWLGLLVRLEQRLFGPLRSGRRIRLDPVETLEEKPCSLRGGNGGCFYVLDRLVHFSFRLLAV